MATIRVLVVEDSETVRNYLCEVLAADPDIDVAGDAADGRQAIELCAALRPDVVTLDMVLPVMSGLAATEYIMAYHPTPILIVSSSVNRGDLFRTYDALAAGAVDVVEKPRGDEPDGAWERHLIATIKLVARIKVITHPRARLASMMRPVTRTRVGLPGQGAYQIVALGASTGGPAALVEILRALPAPYPLPVLVVVHIGQPFGTAFADWLDAETEHRVTYARDGERLADVAGRVVLAPPDRHLVLRDGRLHLTSDPERHSCRPSVDVLFESVARQFGQASVACLLTGMGRDGAAGLLDVRMAGGLTIAQDEATCVVYGMPHEAVELGAVSQVLPLGKIGPALAQLATAVGERR